VSGVLVSSSMEYVWHMFEWNPAVFTRKQRLGAWREGSSHSSSSATIACRDEPAAAWGL
jgi:hypothetical protein